MSTDTTSIVALAQIQPSQTNPRKTFPTESLDELAAGIKKVGVLQPILIRAMPPAPTDDEPHYEIIAGERRYRASKLAGVDTIPARIIVVDDVDVLKLQIIENLQREDMHPLEEAEGYEALFKQHADDPDYSVDKVAAELGKSRAYIYARMKLCTLRPAAREAFYADKLTASTALLLARIPVPALQDKALEEITNPGWPHAGQPMSFRTAAKHIQDRYMTRLDQAPFKLSDEALLPEAGPCTTCPKRTGANPDLFDDVGRADVCTDPICFAAKKEAFRARGRQAALDTGKTVISGKAAEKIKPSQHDSELTGYVDIKASPWWMASDKQVKDILKKDMPETVLIQDPHTGDMIEAIPEDVARVALKAAGITVSRASSQYSANNREQEKKVKAERTYRRALLTDIHRQVRTHLVSGGTLTIEEMRDIAYIMYRDVGHDLRPSVAALWAWPAQDLDAIRILVDQQEPSELALLMLMCVLARNTYCTSYMTDDSLETPDDLLQACAQYGVDPKAIKHSLQPPTVRPAAAKKTTAKAAPTQPIKKPIEPVKYHNLDTGATWSGRGKPPRWIVEAEEDGHVREEFLTQDAAQAIAIDATPPNEPAAIDTDLAYPTLKPEAAHNVAHIAETHHAAI